MKDDLKYNPVRFTAEELLARAAQRPGFMEAYEALADEYKKYDEEISAAKTAKCPGQSTQ